MTKEAGINLVDKADINLVDEAGVNQVDNHIMVMANNTDL